MKKYLFTCLFVWLCVSGFGQKTVFIPAAFSTDAALKEWSWDRSYQSANFVVFWGPVVGTSPATYSDVNLRFNPQSICDTLEKIYTRYVTQIGFCSDAPTKNLGKYKLIIVMNDTWKAGGPSGWAFGGSYDNTIGAMWVHPNATRDGGVISHELTHSLQGQNAIQENTTGGGFNTDIAGFFWECHANFMRTQMYPQFAGDDMPRWMGTSSFHWSSTRHHYASFRLLIHMQMQDGIGMVNRLWKESTANEHPLMTFRRLKGYSQSQLNDFVYDYAKREVALDYPVNNFGTIMRNVRNQLKNNEPHYMWRTYTILKQINATSGRYIVPDEFAPQDYGYNLIPLYTTCSNNTVSVKFKGHTETSGAGWRYGFVAVKADGTISRYSTLYSANESEISFQLNSGESQVFLVVVGAPTTHTSYVWEPGHPKIKRYPYELTIANAVPEGYQSNFRLAYKTNGHVHTNGGGWVANSATVASTVYVGPKAIVYGNSNVSGNARIDGTAWVENATVRDNVIINGNANVWGGTYSGSAQITGNAILNSTTVSGSAIIKGDALLFADTFGGSVVVGGDAEIVSCSNGVYLQFPHPNNGRTDCDGKTASDASNQDVNVAYTQFTDAQMAFSTPPTCSTVSTPSSAFTASPLSASVGSAITFTNQSTNSPTSYLWDFGDGQTSTVASPTHVYTATGTFTVKLTATNSAGSNTLTKTGYITISGSTSAVLSRTGWTIKYYDSQETAGENGAAANVLDGNTATIWHTQWSGTSTPAFPHELQIDMKASYSVTGLSYLPRQNGETNGTIAGYQVFVSTDGTNWGSAVATGTWAANTSEKTVTFTAKTGRYIRLVATSEINGNSWASASEINVIGSSVSARLSANESTDIPISILLYPNPVQSTVTIDLSGFTPDEKVSVLIYDGVLGRQVLTSELGSLRTLTITTDIFDTKSGLYVIKAVSGSKVCVSKMIVTK